VTGQGASAVWVSVDSNRCTGHARCHAVAPDVFTLDDEGFSDIGEFRQVPSEQADIAERGVLACPELALSIGEL